MKALRDFFSNWMLVIIFLAWIFMNYWMFFGQGGFSDIMKISDGKLIPDLCLYQTNDNLMETLSAWGAEGRLNYKRYQFRDFIYPMVYAALLFGMMIRLIRPKSINVWLFLPILAMIFDFMDNQIRLWTNKRMGTNHTSPVRNHQRLPIGPIRGRGQIT